MNKDELKKKLQDRNPLPSTRQVVKPVDFYANTAKQEESEKPENSAKTHNRTNALSHNRTNTPTIPFRVNRGYKLREDLIKACKAIANDESRKLYEVMEEALSNLVAMKEKKV